jgi:hypothetical protein
MDAIMVRGGFGTQMTDEPKPENAPDGLFEPLQNWNRTDGDFDGQTLSSSLVTWLDTHPAVKRGALAGAALVLATALRARSRGIGER